MFLIYNRQQLSSKRIPGYQIQYKICAATEFAHNKITWNFSTTVHREVPNIYLDSKLNINSRLPAINTEVAIIIHRAHRLNLIEGIARNVINPVANEDVRKLRAFSLNQAQFPYWRPPLPVTFRPLPVMMTSLPVDHRTF